MVKSLNKEWPFEPDSKEKYWDEFNKISSNYIRLGMILEKDLTEILEKSSVDYETVSHRIKNFDNFLDKIERKNYKDPFNDIEDICGFRITCHYLSYVKEVSKIINDEFNVLEDVDKSKLLEEDEFGYLSQHFIVKLKKSWLKDPRYRDLGDLKFEIQVRTSLQHVWADISHNLAYKKKEKVPSSFMRQLNRLSAILEETDEKFDYLNYDRQKYIEKLSIKNEKLGKFDLNQKLSLNSLQSFLNFYLPDRKRSLEQSTKLLDEINLFNLKYGDRISFETIWEYYDKYKENLIIDEIRIFDNKLTKKDIINLKNINPEEFEKISKKSIYFSQAGFIKRALTKNKDYSIFLRKENG